MLTHEPDSSSRFCDRALAAGEPAADFIMERRWLAGPGGELTERVAYTNVAHHVVDLASRGFDWGNSGPGSHDLALNILETALKRIGHRGPRSGRLTGTCFVLALLLRSRFVTALLSTLPEEGGSIPTAEVERWIAVEVEKLDDTQRAFLAPRYEWEEAGAGGHWSAQELREIVGASLEERPDGLYSAAGNCIARILEPHPLDAAGWETIPL